MIITTRESNIQIVKSTLSNVINSLSNNMLSYGLGLMLLSQTNSAISFGIEMIIAPAVGVLFVIPIGNLVDKYKHKTVLIVSSLVKILFLLLFILSIDHFDGLYKMIPVIPFVAVNAICANISTVTYSASVHELVRSEKIQRLSSLTNAANSFSNIFAPVLGVSLYALFGFDIFILISIASSSLAFLIMLSLKFHYQTKENISNNIKEAASSQMQGFKEGINYIKKRRLIIDIIVISMFLNFIFSSMNIGIPYIIETELHIGTEPIGYLNTFNAIVLLLGSLFMNFLPAKKGTFLKIMIPVFSLGIEVLLLGTLFQNMDQLFSITLYGGIVSFFIGFSLAIIEVNNMVYLQKTITTEFLGRVMSILTTANRALLPIGSLIYTFLFNSITFGSYIFMGNGILCIAFGLSVFPELLKSVKKDHLFIKEHN
ncbi:MFS transporter [Tetragenococcus halophilus]|uniref:MFS transporter n=2 Tax=Tetragenococcus halophilus TaxID=51669 RepID=A0AB35HR73_TETHA|nr:MFS transporter [Tetragenococcus halophilus]MCO8287629.1 MFS transporter [Tetragenococcus halophilus]MCO8298212.1 MFS transporter [Tetragenococcus halophilus]QXN86874.1 MFS transporter [Tetragenococcus halophilus]GMG69673.1 MFS transporter [Tetragenococcus halophilus]GMQ73843.1 MFS transporter [Tetragenococcus halophilus]